LATADRFVIGVDISPTAVEAAMDNILAMPIEEQPDRKNFELKVESFFDISVEESMKFDFIYDYTFLCALDPSIRNEWALKMAELIKQGGELFTLIYPIGEKEGGPPFQVSLDIVRNLLEPVGFQSIYLDYLPSELCHPGRDGNGETKLTSGIGRWIRM
jgi:hypothetical protein